MNNNILRMIKGLKYPDDYFIKFFFKNALHDCRGKRVLEFGSGNGSNLALPFAYGHEVIGVDFDSALIGYANDNFKLHAGDGVYKFVCADMREFVKEQDSVMADVISLPNIVNYISRSDFTDFINNCNQNGVINHNALLFIRFRTPSDFRYGFGERIDSHTYRIQKENNLTGEAGALNCFYTESEMLSILQDILGLSDCSIFHVDFDNISRTGDIIHNSDIVIWGRVS